MLDSLYLYLHRRLYRRRLKHQVRFSPYVVSVGNLSAGGTGKTPVTIFLAKNAKLNTLVLLRGYGGSKSGEGALVYNRGQLLETAKTAGDEAILFAQKKINVAIGRDRVMLLRRFGEGRELVLLDDAFQNPSVYRDHELVLIDATIHPDDVRIIPYGKFRERPDALIRAHTVLLTRTDLSSPVNVSAWKNEIRKVNETIPIFLAEHRTVIPKKKGPYLAFCGIGNPESFFHLLEKSGIHPLKKITYPDHHQFIKKDYDMLMQQAQSLGASLITTTKDYVRLDQFTCPPELYNRIHTLDIELCIPQKEKAFLDHVLGSHSGR
jgi:tetraacyldisaccharide 4'-kinase